MDEEGNLRRPFVYGIIRERDPETLRNIYNEDTDFNIVRAYEAIATTGGRYGSDPGHVHDHYEGL